jgi:hypothetical protein
MLKTAIAFGFVAATLIVSSAQAMPANCSDEYLTQSESKIDSMSHSEKKALARVELKAARDGFTAKDNAACLNHMKTFEDMM